MTKPIPPWLNDPKGWLSTAQFAQQWNRSVSTIERWCRDGTAIAVGVRLFQDATGRWWLKPPQNNP